MAHAMLRTLRVFSILTVSGWIFTASAQRQPEARTEEVITSEELTVILKDAWAFLRDETDAYLKETEQRGEFESHQEFEGRITRRKAAYIAKVNEHLRDKRYDKRSFGVLLKATLVRYSLDSSVYYIACPVTVEAPYDIPSLTTYVVSNPYVGISDITRDSYRISELYMKFKPHFRWKVDREIARGAKTDSAAIHFKVKFHIDLNQESIKRQARITLVPVEIALMNRSNNFVYWREELR